MSIKNIWFLENQVSKVCHGVERTFNQSLPAQLFFSIPLLHRLGLDSFRARLVLLALDQAQSSIGLHCNGRNRVPTDQRSLARFLTRHAFDHQFGAVHQRQK